MINTADDALAEELVAPDAPFYTPTNPEPLYGGKPTSKKIKTTVMNFYYFNKEGKIINDIAADGMIGILRPLGLSK